MSGEPKALIADLPVFVQRCRVCGFQTMTTWGPETHSESERKLREHIEHHSLTELMAFTMRQHFERKA